ncbi:hypothetical protein EST38_g10946 [Candolleomyces aberdarensis]|uniref:Uncharacterized protein n=1 Tax=Candolleomyces aberdarensis TaxID=2316362 RepID=A0A4Q2D657_9AGAR|nr:hypothetical protein EST38_g10946 [Candolleomyces aberdarensis]
MLYSRFLLASFMFIFLILSTMAAPTGRESLGVAIDSAGLQQPDQLPNLSPDSEAVIQEETHTFDWAPRGSKPSEMVLLHVDCGISFQDTPHPPPLPNGWLVSARLICPLIGSTVEARTPKLPPPSWQLADIPEDVVLN